MGVRDRLRAALAALRGRGAARWTPARDRLDDGTFHSVCPKGDTWESFDERLAAELSAARGSGVALALLDMVESQMLAAMEASAEAPTDEGALDRRRLYQCWSAIHAQMVGKMSWSDRQVQKERLRARKVAEARRDAEMRTAGRASVFG